MSPRSIATSRSIFKKTNTAKLWLLLIGVNQYQDEQIPNLNYSAIDCQGLSLALADTTDKFPNKKTNIYHDFTAESPCLNNIRTTLTQITATAQPDDTVLFYFSGHGILDSSTQRAFLCLSDTNKSNLLDTGLAIDEILQSLNNSAAKNKLVWLDACHSGGMTLRGLTPKLVEVLQQSAASSKGFYALLSCDTNQQSWEFPELGHGVFTYFLMRGLRGEAANAQGLISADGLYRYIYYQTLQYVDKTNQQLRLINQQKKAKGETLLQREYSLQTPKRIVEGVGEIILGKTPKKDAFSEQNRIGVVVEGLSDSQHSLEIGKFLGEVGNFQLEYLQAAKLSADKVREVISKNLEANTAETTLLYLRGRIEETSTWEGIVLGENIRIKRSWLKQLLRDNSAKQIIILDCPNSKSNHHILQQWVEDLQIDSEQGQCLIACNFTSEKPEKFAAILLDILKKTSLKTGLSAAGCISQLQLQFAGSDNFQVWLSGTQGIIEIIPSKNEFPVKKQNQGIDLNICPYMGLNAFSTEDERYFYGREILTQQLIYHIQKTALLSVVGASGSGKSSLVQAGLIPALRQGKQIPNSDKWFIKVLRPGKNPLESIINYQLSINNNRKEDKIFPHLSSLSPEHFVYWLRTLPQPMLILVIDQFEELFTLASIEERNNFLEILLTAVEYASDRFKLIITIRADFISSCLEIPKLTQLLQDYSLLVPPQLNEDDYRRIIVKPAEQVGLKVEPELVEILLRDLDNSVGDLPLLEFVLEQLWQHRPSGKLTLKSYQEKLGGIKGALERSSQAVYESLSPQAQECAKWIFLSLTQLGEGTEDTRRRVFKSELIVEKFPRELVEATLTVFTAAKLIVVNTQITNSSPSITVEVAHEILIRHWKTLRSWLEENRSRLRLQRQIEQAAQLWKHKGEQADFLLQGVRLAEAEDIYTRYTDELSADVRYFVEACLKQRKHQQLQEKIRLRQAQRGLVALSILGIAACSFAVLAYFQAREAKLREIQALNSSTQANLLSNQQLEALINSVEAGKQLQKTVAVPQEIRKQTLNNLQQVLSKIREKNRFHGHKSWVAAASFSPDGEIIASASTDKTIKLWRRDGKLIKTLIGHSDGIEAVSFSPDGKMIASASTDKTIKLWNRGGILLKTFYGHDSGVDSVDFSPDGKLIISGSNDATIKIWDKNGKLLNTLQGHIKGVKKVLYADDGEIIASASDDNTVKLWDSNGNLLNTLQGHTDGVWNLSFSPDGQMIASTSADNTIKLWSRKGDLLQTLPIGKTIKIWNRNNTLTDTFIHHNNQINSISLSPDSKTLATASDDYTVRLWDIDSILQNTFLGHKDEVSTVKFSKDGQKITSVSDDGTMKIWHQDGKLLNTFTAPIDNVTSFNFSPNREILVLGSKNGTLSIFTRDNRLLNKIEAHRGWIININFSPDGKMFATSAIDGTIKLWSRDGKLLQSLNRHSGWVTKVKFSPDGKIIASAGADNTVKLWNINGKLLHNLTGHLNSVWDINFSPNSNIIASGSADKTIKIWTYNGRLIATLKGHSDSITSVIFSHDGKLIASSSDDDTIKLWSHDGKLLKTIKGHNSNVRSLDFSPNGKALVTASADKTVKLWDLEKIELQPLKLNALLQKGCHWLNHYLKHNRNISESEKEVCS